MKTYEITYLTSTEETANAESVRETLSKHGATISSVQPWGSRRKLAYPIKKQDFAFYTTVIFDSEPTSLKPIDQELAASDGVMRFLLIHHVPQPERSTLPDGGTPKPKAAATMSEPATKPVVEAAETPTEVTQPVVAEAADKPKRRAKKTEATDVKALDETLDKLLSEDITK